jgi:Protein of unknown function (DUF2470)
MYNPPSEVVEFIAAYMNDTHADVLVDIATAHAHAADSAKIVDLTSTAMVLELGFAGTLTSAEIPWPQPLQRREDIRAHLQQLQDDARLSSF